MTASRDPDRLIHAFLAEGAEQLDDQVYDAVRAEIEQRRQRAVIGPWRMPTLSKFVPIGLAAAAVIAVLFLGSQFIGSPSSNVGGPASQPPASAAPSEPAGGSAAADASLPEGPFEIEDRGMAMTVTIPASGWTFGDSWNGVSKGGERDNLPEAGTAFWAHPGVSGFDVYGDPCQWESSTPDTPVTTVDDFAAALAAQESRNASEPEDVTVDGYEGRSVTLHVPEDADFSECDRGKFASYGTAGRGEPDRWHQGPGQIDRFWILDVDGTIVTIQAMWRPDTPDELIAEMVAIVESTTFNTP